MFENVVYSEEDYGPEWRRAGHMTISANSKTRGTPGHVRPPEPCAGSGPREHNF